MGGMKLTKAQTELLKRAVKAEGYISPYGPDWTVTYSLKRKGLLQYVSIGHYRITDAGRAALSSAESGE